MLVKYELELKIENAEKNIYNFGSLFQGVIMDNISSKYADKLHTLRYNPYSQYVYLNKDNKVIWSISTIGKEAYEHIIENFILKVDEIYLKYKNLNIKILNKKEVKKTTMKDLFKKYYFNMEVKNIISYQIITPCSYKDNNMYQIVPREEYILKNIINKWNAFSNENYIDEDVYEEYLKRTFIYRYNLKSHSFSIEGIRIQGYMGKISLRINSNDMMKNLLCMLFEFAEFSGIGIKTSIGMGGIKNE